MSEDIGRINCIAVDGSESSKIAFGWYIKNYHQKNDTLVLIYAHQFPQTPPNGILGGYASLADSNQESLESSIQRYKDLIKYFTTICEQCNIKFRTAVEEDYHGAGQTICESVKKHNGTVVILGQRGLGTFSRFLLGSTSDYVLHHSNVPIIVVPLL